MKRLVFFCSLCLQMLAACNNSGGGKGETPASENDMDAARNFIRAALDRNWNEAKKFMLKDSSNNERLNSIEDFYKNEKRDEKRNYHEASINLYDSRKLNDSVTIVNYSNSYKNQRDSVKVVRIDGQWLVDLKYSFLPNDTTRHAH
ncbi:MAG: hypothetical protein ACJ75B_10110 [Flavisolibacter sp.]